ncbi:MAG TPA: SCP2 sterol-binding domain-containing protein [Myxococcota bacterium]|nr:SCP2 sterol-binding domain-containing protein [Myxococcota bacterium]
MGERAVPPDDITPGAFFTRWVPEAVASDPARRARLGSDPVTLEFELEGEGGGVYALRIADGAVSGTEGPAEQPNLRVRLDVGTWRALNRGEMSAPEAFLRRRVHLSGNLLLAVKLHLILG